MKRVTFLIAMLFIFLGLHAQTIDVQGVPRQMGKSVKSEPAVIYPTIDFDNILYTVTVGKGKNISALVIKWGDGKGGNCNLVWGYAWDTPEQGTGEAMLRAIAKADPRFYLLAYGNTQYGAAIGGMGFDLNGNGNIALIKSGVSYPLADGICYTSSYDFDSYTSNDPLDHWGAGWYDGYWSYWVTGDVNTAYGYSGVGATSRQLKDGSVDGWSYVSDMTDWYSGDMSGTVCYVNEPSATKAGYMPFLSSSKVKTVNTLDEFYTVAEQAVDGDTIQFYAGLRGKAFENTTTELFSLPSVNLTLIGNGVIIEGGSGWSAGSAEEGFVNQSITDFTFKNLKGDEGQAIFMGAGCNLTVEKCVFEGMETPRSGAAIGARADDGSTLNVRNCRFSGIKSEKGGALNLNTTNNVNKKLYANIVSCTFEGNQGADNATSIYLTNYPTVQIVNCVFENDKSATETPLPVVGLNRPNKLPAEQLKMAYNVIEGTVSSSDDEIKRLSDTDYNAATYEKDALGFENGEYLVVKDGLAYNHLPANTTIEGITWAKTDLSGIAIDYTKATHSGACQQIYKANVKVDYTKGRFIVNEDWFGHQNSTVNFLTDEGEWIYRVFQKENPGLELGCTSNFGTIYGDKFYIVCKQAKDPGATLTGGRLNVCDAKTMKCIKQFENIATKAGVSVADGRAFLGVNEHKGYISTSNGIYLYNIDRQEIEDQLSGTGNSGGSLYEGQIGTMIRVNEKVFAVHQSAGLLVIDAEADTLIQTIKAPKETVDGTVRERGFGSVVVSKDGNLWVSVAANTSGQGATMPYIFKVDPATCDTTRVNMPEGINSPSNSWYAWTADGFCSSKQHNCLYWNGGDNSWFSGKNIYKYDIDRNAFEKIVNLENTDWKIYGACLRVDPVTDEIYTSLYHEFQNPEYKLFKYDNEGNELAQYAMVNNYWFPALPVFPDNAAPVVTPVAPVSKDSQDPFVISLAALATDADNQDALIVKSVKAVSNEDVLTAIIRNGDLKVIPAGAKGSAEVSLEVNSNGKMTDALVSIVITKESGIAGEQQLVRSAYGNGQRLFINNCDDFNFGLYHANGQLIGSFHVTDSSFSTQFNVPAGIYYLKGNKGEEAATFKVIFN